MSNLQNFVGAKRSASPFQDRKKLAANARVNTRAKNLLSPQNQTLPSTAPPLGYDSNLQGQRNTFPNPQHHRHNKDEQEPYGDIPAQYTNAGGQEGVFDVTLTTDFDDTITDGIGSPKQSQSQPFPMDSIAPSNILSNTQYQYADGYEEEEGYRWVDDPSQHPREEVALTTYNRRAQQDDNHQSHPSLPPALQEERMLPVGKGHQSTPAITGRFEDNRIVPTHVYYTAMGKDTGEAMESPVKQSKKRSRNVDEKLQSQDFFRGQPSQSKVAKNIAHSSDSSQSVDEQHDVRTGFEESVLSEGSSEGRLGKLEEDDTAPQAVDLGPDYSDDELANMSYDSLAKETWDLEHHERGDNKSDGLPTSEDDLKARFETCLKEEIPVSNEFPPNQVAFFTKLSIEQWEQTGDLFLEKFEELIKKMRTSRQNKRKLVSTFEKQIGEREEVVRSKSIAVELKLNTMKKGGESVLRDATLNRT